jgi:hypothetical protein
LTAQLGISRASVWRLVATLRARGWVRMRLGDQKIELSYRIDQIFSKAHFSDEEFEPFFAHICELSKDTDAAFDFIAFEGMGQLALIETTQRNHTNVLGCVSLVNDPVAIALQIACAPTKLVRHLRAYVEVAPKQDVARIESGCHYRTIKEAQCPIWEDYGASLCVPVVGSKGTPGVIRIMKRNARISTEGMLRMAYNIHQRNAEILAYAQGGAPDTFAQLSARFALATLERN